jgi:pyridoxine 4-dehydrogenase
LQLNQVPVVNLRRHPEAGVPFDEQVAAMAAMRDVGLIGAVGLSNVTTQEFARARTITGVACVQNAYNLADRSDQTLLDACTADEIPYVPFFPLGSAFHRDKPVLTAPAVVAVAKLAADPRYVVSDAPSREPRGGSAGTRPRSHGDIG